MGTVAVREARETCGSGDEMKRSGGATPHNRLVPRPPRPYQRIVSALPFIDEHRVHVRASVEQARDAVEKIVQRLATQSVPRVFAALWRLEPASGFAVAESSGERIVLVGRHRFARYELGFEVRAAEGGAEVWARTSGEFPGALGWLYRVLVIGSGGHGVAVRGMLRGIRGRAEEAGR
jgi:hypothetical protein